MKHHKIVHLAGISLVVAFSLVYTKVFSKELWSAIRLVDDDLPQTFSTPLRKLPKPDDANIDKVLVCLLWTDRVDGRAYGGSQN